MLCVCVMCYTKDKFHSNSLSNTFMVHLSLWSISSITAYICMNALLGKHSGQTFVVWFETIKFMKLTSETSPYTAYAVKIVGSVFYLH